MCLQRCFHGKDAIALFLRKAIAPQVAQNLEVSEITYLSRPVGVKSKNH